MGRSQSEHKREYPTQYHIEVTPGEQKEKEVVSVGKCPM